MPERACPSGTRPAGSRPAYQVAGGGTGRLQLRPAGDRRRQAGKPLGDSDAGPPRPVALGVGDARHHLHVVGATGTGKSTLLTNLILADAAAGRGVAVLDPKGDLVGDVLARLPAEAADRLVLIDPAETLAPAALNVLDTTGQNPELVTDRVVGVFARLYAAYWGPRIEDVLRCACLTLTRQPHPTFGNRPAGAGQPVATLADIPRLLSDPRYRTTLVGRITDPTGLGGFWSWYDALTDAARAAVIGPVMTKLRGVLTRRFAVDLLGASASTFNLTQILDGGILLAGCPKVSSVMTPPAWSAPCCCPRCGKPPPPGSPWPNPIGSTPRSTSTNATTSCTYPARRATSLPKPAVTTCRWSWPTSTSVSCPASSPTPSPPTPATRPTSPSAPTTPASWPVTSAPTFPQTT